MKESAKKHTLLFAAIAVLFFQGAYLGAAETPPPRTVEEAYLGPYWEGSGGAELSVAVAEPAGVEVGDDDAWLLSLVQGSVIKDIRRFTLIKVAERQGMEKSADSKEAGRQAGVKTLISGTLARTGKSSFVLSLTATDIEKGTIQASYTSPITFTQITGLSGIKEGTLALIKGLGVTLTENGAEALALVLPDERQAEIALARGITAGKSGNTIESLNYLYNARSYDSGLLDVSSRLDLANSDFLALTTGEKVKNDLAARQNWAKILDDFEAFYTAHPPFEVIYTVGAVQRGITDYDNQTAVLQFTVTLREGVEFQTMNRILKSILDGLKAAGRQEQWGFGNWPYRSPLFRTRRVFNLTANLENDQGEVLDTADFQLWERMSVMRGKVFPDSSQNRAVVFKPVIIDKITGELIRITSIDGMDAAKSQEEGFVKIIPAGDGLSIGRLPRKAGRNVLAKMMADFLHIR